ncbi:MAG TPA: hypothetical protein VGF55_05860 [Gemmataceae bacterium]|jgi:hypothetical protein
MRWYYHVAIALAIVAVLVPVIVGTFGVAAIALLVYGCDARQAHALAEQVGMDMLRQHHVALNGPMIVTSVVGLAAPGGGPPGLSPLCGDATWRLVIAHVAPKLKHIPSPFEVQDHPIQPITVERHAPVGPGDPPVCDP